MDTKPILIPDEKIERGILLLRGQKIMLDMDLAKLYQVPTFRLNETVRRNLMRFPSDFMFQLSEGEKKEVIANCDHLKKPQILPSTPLRLHGTRRCDAVFGAEE